MRSSLRYVALVGLALGSLNSLHGAEPEFDLNLNQAPARPLPKWVKMIDQGEHNPKLSGLKTPAGIRVDIVADSPAVINPVGMQFSNDGTLWVLEWTVAPNARQENYDVTLKDGTKLTIHRMAKDTKDLLKTLHDTNKDGIYDESRVVMKDLEIPSSLFFHDGWVYLPSVGHLIRRKQSEPGGAYDLEEEILRGFCGFHHHQLSGVTMGHDGYIYVTSGDDDNRGEGSDGSRIDVMRTGAIIRCRPDGSQVTEFSRGFRNPYRDVVFDENYNMFHVDNDQEDGSKFQGVRIMHIPEGSDFGWRLFPGVVCCRSDFQRLAVSGELPGKLPVMLKTGRGSPAGLLHYTGSHMPLLKGAFIYADVYRKMVRGYHFEQDGATFRVKEEFVLMEWEDDLFRPCQTIQGPDGAIYVADWRANSGGAGRLWGDGVNGRIYKLSWPGDAPIQKLKPMNRFAEIATLGDEALIKKLQSEDFDYRRKAAEELLIRARSEAGRGEKIVNKLIESFAAAIMPRPDNTAAEGSSHFKIHAIGIVQNFWNKGTEGFLAQAARDQNPNVRRIAVDALANHLRDAETKHYHKPQYALRLLNQLLADEKELAVKRQVLLALAKIYGEKVSETLSTELVKTLVEQVDDVYYLDGCIRGVELTGMKGIELVAKELTSEEPARREAAVYSFEAFRTREAADVLAAVLGNSELKTEHRIRLFGSYRNYQFEPPITAEPVANWLEKNPTAPVGELMSALNAISLVGGVEPARLNSMILKLVDSDDVEVRRSVMQNVRELQLAAAAPALTVNLTDEKRTIEERREILQTLSALRAREAIDALKEMCRVEGELRADALQTLFQIRDREAQAIAAETLDAKDTRYLATAVNILGATPEGAKSVGEQFVAGKLPKNLLPVVTDALKKHAEKSTELATLMNEAMKGALLVSLEPEEIKKVEELVKSTGNPANGLRIFLDQGKVRCVACHKLEGIGGQIGPDLSRVWETHSITKIMESMIDPSKEIKEGFQTFVLETKGGLTHSGLKVLDDKKVVVIRDAQGNDIRVPVEEVESLQAETKSLMPENVIALLQYQDFIDLVAFLKSRESQENLRNSSWWTVGPFPEDINQSLPFEAEANHETAVTGADGKMYSWNPTLLLDGKLDLRAIYKSDHVSAYVLTYIHSEKDQEVEFLIGSDDQLRIWLNGAKVHEYLQSRSGAPDQDKLKLTLKKGFNTFLAKVSNGVAGHELYVRIPDAEGVTFHRSKSPESAGK